MNKKGENFLFELFFLLNKCNNFKVDEILL